MTTRNGRPLERRAAKITVVKSSPSGSIEVRLPSGATKEARSAQEARAICDKFVQHTGAGLRAGLRIVGVIEWYGFGILEVPTY